VCNDKVWLTQGICALTNGVKPITLEKFKQRHNAGENECLPNNPGTLITRVKRAKVGYYELGREEKHRDSITLKNICQGLLDNTVRDSEHLEQNEERRPIPWEIAISEKHDGSQGYDKD
jgi:phosphoribosylformylglycinamidine (FGAM) synthase PurS component